MKTHALSLLLVALVSALARHAAAPRLANALKTYPEWFLRGERSPAGRFTFATWKHYEKNAPLLPSGLLGPVTLRVETAAEFR